MGYKSVSCCFLLTILKIDEMKETSKENLAEVGFEFERLLR